MLKGTTLQKHYQIGKKIRLVFLFDVPPLPSRHRIGHWIRSHIGPESDISGDYQDRQWSPDSKNSISRRIEPRLNSSEYRGDQTKNGNQHALYGGVRPKNDI